MKTALAFRPANADAELSVNVPDDDNGTLYTLWGMAAFCDDAAANSPELHLVARAIPRTGNTPRDVFNYLRRRVRFHSDPDSVEWVRHPEMMAREILSNGYCLGDCDDVATLGAALLKVLGEKPVFFVVGLEPESPFVHVTYGVRKGERLIPLDSQHGFFGKFPAIARRVSPFEW